MKTIIILAMHGVPPHDFPRAELAEFFTLQGQLRRGAGQEKSAALERYSQLNTRIKNWPRTARNDPFYAASHELARHLSGTTNREVVVGFNEFCAPDLQEALEMAVRKGAAQIVVVTPMMTRGGEHAEVEIPALLKAFHSAHPEIQTVYAWPFDIEEVARFLSRQIARFTAETR